jgi:hypothetical protein
MQIIRYDFGSIILQPGYLIKILLTNNYANVSFNVDINFIARKRGRDVCQILSGNCFSRYFAIYGELIPAK